MLDNVSHIVHDSERHTLTVAINRNVDIIIVFIDFTQLANSDDDVSVCSCSRFLLCAGYSMVLSQTASSGESICHHHSVCAHDAKVLVAMALLVR